MVNLLVPRNLEGRKDKLKQLNIRFLSQEVIDGDLILDESFMDIDSKFVKLKKLNGRVWLNGGKWTEIPEWLKDVEISGYFDCTYNKLTSLKNCPQKIEGSFYCYNNQLISLEGCIQKIGGSFYCYNNQLISLEGCPKNILWSFHCSNNKLLSLEGCPETVGMDFICSNNETKLYTPDYIKIGRVFRN
jgi:hypothetical protein